MGQAYYGLRKIFDPEGNYLLQPYYRSPGLKFSNNYNSMQLRPDPNAHYLRDFGLEFYYSNESTSVLAVLETTNKWVMDNAGYSVNNGSEFVWSRDVHFEQTMRVGTRNGLPYRARMGGLVCQERKWQPRAARTTWPDAPGNIRGEKCKVW